MASSSAVKYLNSPICAVILFLILMTWSLTLFFSPSSAETIILEREDGIDWKDLKRMKVVLGSKPPRCVNKCLSCRPCMAALVIYPQRPNNNNNNNNDDNSNVDHKKSPHEHETSYYLLAWKCKCRDKIFQP